MEQLLHAYELWRNLPGDERFVLDLQRFAAEDEGRTEEPTEKKIREAREKGQVARTQELPQAVVVIFGFMVIFMFSSFFYEVMARITKYYLSSFSTKHITERSILLDLFAIMGESSKVILPVFAAVVIAAIIGNVIQVGFQVSTHPLKMDWSKIKIDPATMLRKIFFSKQVAMNLFKSLFKLLAIGLVAYLIIQADFYKIMSLADVSVPMALKIVLITGFKIIIWSSILLLALSIPDFYFQKQELMESLKMSKQEVKEELKETMGDPYMKARLRDMQRDIVMRGMVSKEVPGADVVVTNPTHFAVALKYDMQKMHAPIVVASGVDSIALKIRQVARENSVPIIENRPLARELYYYVEIGDFIPAELFAAVVAVYKELYEKNRYRPA